MDRQPSPARDTDAPLTRSEPQELFEGETETGVTATTAFPTLAVEPNPTVDASDSPSLLQTSPVSPQRTTTLSTPSIVRRRTRDTITIMPPIHEEEYAESSTTDQEDSEASDTDSTVSQQQQPSLLPAPLLTAEITSQPSPVSTQLVSSSTAQPVTGHIGTHSSTNSPQIPLIGRPAHRGQMAATLLSRPPLFSYNEPHIITNCWFGTCAAPTMSSDNRTVACPRCNDHSCVRYCSSIHLLSDMRDHYIHHCGRRPNLLAVDESTMTPLRTPTRAFIPVAQDINDSVERHRQALYHAYPPESESTTDPTTTPSDYYVFNDADQFLATGLQVTVGNLYPYRGNGSIAGRVRYEDTDPRKALFVSLLERLLVLGVAAGREKPAGCRLLFVWIKENLQGQEGWSEEMITRMCLAMQLEFGWRVDEEVRY